MIIKITFKDIEMRSANKKNNNNSRHTRRSDHEMKVKRWHKIHDKMNLVQFVLLMLLLINCMSANELNSKLVNKTSKFVPEFSSNHNDNSNTTSSNRNIQNDNNNKDKKITILHEVFENNEEELAELPLVLNTHEVLPMKPVKKKLYSTLDKLMPNDAKKVQQSKEPVRAIDLHPVTFDFNLGDLEDLENDTSKSIELSSSEEKHILSTILIDKGITSPESDKLMTYKEGDAREENVSEGLDVEISMDDNNSKTDNSSSSSVTLSDSNTLLATAALSAAQTNSHALPTVVTVSPHIFKVLKNKTSKKGRELLKGAPADDSSKRIGYTFNSLNGFHDRNTSVNAESISAEMLHTANIFQIITNLFDHFYWQASDMRPKITTACGLEMQAYLTALHANLEWAQKAYDASGRYRGQFLYGNDKWVGVTEFCQELNHQLQPDERKHFEFGFYAATIAMRIWIPKKLELQLQLGECLPKSCTSQDVHAILALDPHAQMLANLAHPTAPTASSNSSFIHVRRVRTVPGIFSYWRELKFQLFASFLMTLILIVIAATWYQAKLNQSQFATVTISAISAKVDASAAASKATSAAAILESRTTLNDNYARGSFELYQMRTLGDNNNVLDVERDANGNKTLSSVEQASCCKTSNENQALDLETQKAQMAIDYKIETNSSAGATATYEAKKQLGLHEQVLLCFAFQTNAGVILNMDDNKESQTSCIHGLRVFSVLWTILVHTYLQLFTVAENRFRRVIVERSIWYQFVGNATFSVDTFFFISGFLVTLLFLRQSKKYPEETIPFMRRSFKDILMLLLHRYIRLTPSYLFVILFNDFALRQSSDSSVFQTTVPTHTCNQYWWRNILYINNFYPLSEICMIWSWYMANDMQFYIMATILLTLSIKYFKPAALIVIGFLLSSWGLSGVISLHYKYTHKVAKPFESFDFLYDKPWQRVGPYIVGMITGYILFKMKTPPRISGRLNFFLSAASFGLLALVIFGVWNGELSRINTAFYVSIGHTAFGLGLVWILLSCCWGLSPTFNRILSYRGLWPLSRLTFCTYLIHPVLMLISSMLMNGTVHLSHLFMLTMFLGNVVLSFVVAFFISALLEAPVIRLLKVFWRK